MKHLSSLPTLERGLSPLPCWENPVKHMGLEVYFHRFLGRPLDRTWFTPCKWVGPSIWKREALSGEGSRAQ